MRRRPETTRYGITHKVVILAQSDEDGGKPVEVQLFITTNQFPDGQLAEIFITPQREGSTIAGLLDCIATLTSIALQYGVPLELLVSKFSHTRFEPHGPTISKTNIKYAKSLVDYIFRYLGETYGGIPAEVVIDHVPEPEPDLAQG